ncbi:DUF695 domain-containing protein [Nocardioides dongxiaopingii]|uniref:DUF695 domain-containing protein n=1 Tax=Nocardioides dongxiaopingii TaxID=2576036 RepID=UPI0010C76D08|nr:DUF695 domain-containing protein [Nocardioides dongxiaopingii]
MTSSGAQQVPEPDPGSGDPTEFWLWWAEEGAGACEAAIESRSFEAVTDEINARVHAVDPRLVWELGPGREARHVLVVTSEGDAGARAVARRWLRAAPAPSATWEYADARQAEVDVDAMVLKVGETEVDFAAVRVVAERVGNHVDVVVHHPAMASLPEQARNTVAFLALDATLGENDCETWVGAVEVALAPPVGATLLAALREVVAEVRDDSVDEHGTPVWVLLRGEVDGAPIMAAAQVPLAGSWAPQLDTHVAVAVPYRRATEQGLPDPGTLESLRALEDHLGERLGDSARLVAHETSSGTRTLHFYADSTTPAAAVLQAAVTGWDQGRVTVAAQPDPAWHAVRHLRT